VNAKVVTTEYDSCTVTTIDFPTMPDLRVKYVENSVATTGNYTVEFYEKYVEALGDALGEDGADWDHFLDQHIGVMYACGVLSWCPDWL
jgi:hypothetical protein